MSKLEQLIAELCPEGVEYVNIGSVVDYEQPSKYIVKSTDYSDNFDIPVLTAGQSFILGHTNETENLYNASRENPVIIFDDFTAAFKWVDFPFKVKSSAMKMLIAKREKATLRYIFHVMSRIGYFSDEHKRLWISIYSEISIPLPPLPVQEEIVRVLDNFTELTVELTVELTARKKQYEYYRERLLTFGDDVPMVPLGKICKIGDGLHGTPKYDDSGEYYFINGNNLKNGKVFFDSNTKKVDSLTYEKHKILFTSENTVFMSVNGTIGNVSLYNNEKIALGKSVAYFNILNSINTEYLFYLLQTDYSKRYYESHKTGSTIKNLGLKALREYSIPLPLPEEQQRIVDVLNRFDTLCSDISNGLPAEIEARQKQYEYYRDKLLTFPKAEIEV